MFFAKIDRIGSKTINKIAEKVFKKQIKQVQSLTINVQTNRKQLSKGILDILDIDGDGLIMRKNFSLEKMKLTLYDLTVSPLKALMGNIELIRPSEGDACIVLNEKDIETALDLDSLNQQLGNYNPQMSAKFSQVSFRVLTDEILEIEAQMEVFNTSDSEQILLTLKPRFCQDKQDVVLEVVNYASGQQSESILIEVLLMEAKKILSLDNLSSDGVSFKVNNLMMEKGKINFDAFAGIRHLPIR